MSRLEELIQQYCPDGVEYKPLGEVCDFRNGFAFKSNLFTDEGCPIIRITNISENNVDMSDLKYFHMEDYPKSDLSQFAIKKGDILVAMSGATTGKIGTYKGNITAYLNQRTGKFEPKESLNNRFLYHFLQTQVSNMYKMAGGGAQPNLSSNDLKSKIVIPVPPLPVQEEIVRILDNFAELQAELQVELQAELQKRLQQYNYYRDNLLSFEGRTDVEWKKLGEVCDIKGRIGFRGYTRQDLVEEADGAITLSPSNIINQELNYEDCSYISWAKYEESPEIKVAVGDVIFTKTASVGKTALVKYLPKEATINPQLVVLKNIQCNSAFLAYVLKTYRFQQEVSKLQGVGSVPNISQTSLSGITIPILPLAEQQRIVDILDRFSTLTTDITAGLPAEIEARRKQYEYYRDKLLTFKKK